MSLELHPWKRVGGRLIRADSHKSSDNSVKMSNELTFTLASIQEFMVGISRCFGSDREFSPGSSSSRH